jgi:hypothetical protein
VGATERAKYHIKNSSYLKDNGLLHSVTVFVLEPIDKAKPMLIDKFKELIANPPESYFLKASELLERERKQSIAKNVTIMRLEKKVSSVWRKSDEMVWKDAGKASEFSDKETFYYIPLSGFKALNKCQDVKSLHRYLDHSNVFIGSIYGVRKGDIEFIKAQPNWVELDTYIVERLEKLDQSNVMGVVKQTIDIKGITNYNSNLINSKSPYKKLMDKFKDVEAVDSYASQAIKWLCAVYKVKTNSNPQDLIDKYSQRMKNVHDRYPLLKSLSYSVDHGAVAEYINMIDEVKGI